MGVGDQHAINSGHQVLNICETMPGKRSASHYITPRGYLLVLLF